MQEAGLSTRFARDDKTKIEPSVPQNSTLGPADCIISPAFSVQQVQFLARLEADRLAGSDGDLGPGPGIAADAGFARTHIKDAKAAQLDPVSRCQRLLEAFKDGVYGCLRLVPRQPGLVDDMVDDVLFYQCSPRTYRYLIAMDGVTSTILGATPRIVNQTVLP